MRVSLIVHDALRDLIRGLSPHLKSSVRRALDDILKEPLTGKPLSEELEELRSYKIGRFRVIYRVEGPVVTLIAIGPRQIIYQKLSLDIKHQLERQKGRK